MGGGLTAEERTSMRLEVRGLRFGYAAGRMVLDGVELDYESPQVMCILGHNGVGKSTLLQCIVGIERPAGGSVLVDGRPVGDYSYAELARRFAYIPQTHNPSFSYPVIDVVTMGRTAHMGYLATPSREDVDIAHEQLSYLGIDHLADRPYTEVSGGERQLVMIASALAQEPKALLLDEPTAHLDFGNQFRFVQLVERLHRRGIGVLMTTHAPDQALLLGCTCAILANGRIEACGPACEVVTEEALGAIYGIDVHLAQVERRTVCIPGSLSDPLGEAAGLQGKPERENARNDEPAA